MDTTKLSNEMKDYNFQETAIKKVAEDMSNKRMNLIIERLKNIGITLDVKKEERARFKSLTRVFNGLNEETIYYNDGSENGLRVITFVTEQKTMNGNDLESMSITCETSYY